jgi:hypothetical protein
MFETVRDDAERKRLDRRFLGGMSICQYTRKFKDCSNPSAVVFLLDLHHESHRNPLFPLSSTILLSALRRR